MQGIIAFFEGIGNAIVSAFQFIVTLIEDIVSLVQGLVWAVAQIPKFLFWIPSEISATVLLLISFAVLYKVLGREG